MVNRLPAPSVRTALASLKVSVSAKLDFFLMKRKIFAEAVQVTARNALP
jgi:hypothetical protein